MNMMQRIKKKLMKLFSILLRTLILSVTIGVLKDLISSFAWYSYLNTILDAFFTPFFFMDNFTPFFFMDNLPGGSSSSAPQSEPGVNQEAPTPDPDLPLLDDDTRRDELNARAGYHFAGLSEESKEQILEAQLSIDRAIEKALLSNGYSRNELNQLTKRNEIRGFLFYPRGKLLSLRKYKQWAKEVEFGTLRSKPYNEIMKAIRSSKLFLTNVKPIKRWELNKNQWR